MDRETFACIGRNTTLDSLREKMSKGPVPLKLLNKDNATKKPITLYTHEFVEKYNEHPMDLAEVEQDPVAHGAQKWTPCVIKPWKFTSIIVSPKTKEDAGKVWGEINDGGIKDQFVLLCATMPEDGMMRWFDPRAMEFMDIDYDVDANGEIYGEPLETPDWAGKDEVLVARLSGVKSKRYFRMREDDDDAFIHMKMIDAIVGGSFVFHKPDLKAQTIYYREHWIRAKTRGVTLDKFISQYCTVHEDYAGCGEVLGKGVPLNGCICDTDPERCKGVKGKKKVEHRKHFVIPFDVKTNLVLDIDLKSVGGRVVSSDPGERDEQGKDVQIQMLAYLDEMLKKFCRNGGNKEFRMDKIDMDHMGYAVHTSHGIKHDGKKEPVAVLSYHIVQFGNADNRPRKIRESN